MNWPRYSLPTTATVSCIYAAGMLLSIGYLYLAPSVFDYRGPASEAYQAGEYATAAEYYGRIVELRPEDSEAHFFRGYSLGAQGDLHGALASFDAALELAPHAESALTGKALLLLHLSRFQEAAEIGTRFHSEDSYLFVQYVLAYRLLESGDLEQAERVLRQAVGAHTAWSSGYFGLGCVLNRSGRTREAVEALDRAKALDPTIGDVGYESVWLKDPSPDWPLRDDDTIPSQPCQEG